MPELPEVETIKRGLKKYLVGKEIIDIKIRLQRLFTGDKQQILHTPITDVRRYGKGIVIDFANKYSLAAHVKMTGQFVYKETQKTDGTKETEGKEKLENFHQKLGIVGELPNKHTHVIFKLKTQKSKGKSKGTSYLYYNDIRQFGWMKVIKTSEVSELPFFKGLGPEPFTDLTLPLFRKITSSSVMPIKSVLMDQKKIAGIGNIYANDALYLAQIHPNRPASSLTQQEQKKLYEALLNVLQKGIDLGGASETNYINVEGGKGGYQNHFLVYRKHGSLCPVCGTEIIRSVIAGRGTFFCPKCQV